jgi:hypothetical protein
MAMPLGETTKLCVKFSICLILLKMGWTFFNFKKKRRVQAGQLLGHMVFRLLVNLSLKQFRAITDGEERRLFLQCTQPKPF